MLSTMRRKSLISSCVEILDLFDSSTTALEDHLQHYITCNKELKGESITFLEEVFGGCVRFMPLLRVLTKRFLKTESANILRSEENLYIVLGYLLLFRLRELGVADYKSIVYSQNVNKMYKWHCLVLNSKTMLSTIRNQWYQLYEQTWVDMHLIQPYEQALPDVYDILAQLKDRIDNKVASRKKVQPKTDCQPFNLTKPKPRAIPMPEEIPKLAPHRRVPPSTYDTPLEEGRLEQERAENRRLAEELLTEARRQQFTCAVTEKSERTQRRMRELVAEEERLLSQQPLRANPVPHSMLAENVPVKLNAASILREGRLYQQQEQEQLQRLERLEAGARDTTEFLEWQGKMKDSDFQQQMAAIEERRLKGKLSHEEAILAKERLTRENKLKVDALKEESARLMRHYLWDQEQEERKMRGLVEAVVAGHGSAKQAKERLKRYKADIVRQVAEESRELLRAALEEAEQQMKAKVELIQQIRAMESTPVIRQKLVDITQAAGHGLLGEMSIAELRERLALLKVIREREEDDRRDRIHSNKLAKNTMLMDTLETISRHRSEKSRAAALVTEQRKLERAQGTPSAQAVNTDPKILELRARLMNKRAERMTSQEERVKQGLKSAPRLTYGGTEHGRWEALEKSRQRTARTAALGQSGRVSTVTSQRRLLKT